jgi:hypothetical protein
VGTLRRYVRSRSIDSVCLLSSSDAKYASLTSRPTAVEKTG